MVHRRKFVRDSLGYAFSQYLARGVLLARGLVAAAALGPAGFGGWNALNLILDYGGYAPFGVLYGLDLRLPSAVEQGRRERVAALARGAWSLALTGGLLFAAGVGLYLAAGQRAIEAGWGWGPPALMLGVALLQIALTYHASVLRAHGRIQAVSAATALQSLLGGGLGMALVLPLGVWGLIGGWAAGQAAALVWMRRAGVAVPLRPLARPPLGELLGAGFVISAFFATALVVRSADRFAFLRYLGNEPLGHYSLGFIAAGLVLYLPEAAGYVLYPRVAAAAGGARDPQPARLQTLQVQRALCVALPLAVGLGVLWVEPTLRALLPTYLPGAPAVRVLACGALMLSAATVPSYYLLGTGHERGLLALGAVAALFTTALVFRAAVVGHNATAVAWAAATGDVTFSLLVVGFAAGVLAAGTAARLRFVAGSFLPALWGSALALALARWRPGVGGALAASAVFTAAYAPVLVLVGRGAGFGRLAREFFPAGAAARSGA